MRTDRLPIVVTGMHRSGTSLAASLVAASSVDMGRSLLPGDLNNQPGYFEDVEFLELQQKILAECCETSDGGHPDWGWTESESFNAARAERFSPEARVLIDARRRAGTLWGWKDPRTTLLLEFWDELLHDAFYVFVYRFPWDVADSMQRLGADVFLSNPEYAYRIWTFYNRRILDFHEKHSDRCMLVSANALEEDITGFTSLLARKLGIESRKADPDSIYRRDLFNTTHSPDPLIDLVAAVWPECTRILSELDEMADLSSSGLWEAHRAVTRLSRPGARGSMSQPADLSIVIPTLDQGVLLIEAIASVERNAPPNCELIIINDGSSQPRALEILRILKDIGYFVLDQANAGLSGARNNGIAIASGRYILPLDDDNRILAGFLDEAIKVLDSAPEVGVVYGDRRDFGLRRVRQRIPEFDLDAMLEGNYIDACAVFRKRVWADCGGYDPAASPVEDWEMWIHAAERGWKFHRIPRVTFEYRVRPGSLLSRIQSAEAAEDRRRIIRVKHSELYRSAFLNRIEELTRKLAASDALGLELAAKVAVKEDENGLLRREVENSLAVLAESDRALQALRTETDHELLALRTEADREMRSLRSEADHELRVLRSEAGLKRSEIEALSARLAEREAEVARMKGTYGWRFLSIYGRIKHRYLLRVYRLLGLDHNDRSSL